MRGQYYVYILASRPGGAIYVGVTNDLIRRVYEHKNGLVPGFTKRYGIDQLVYFEIFDTAYNAIQREKHQALAARLEDPARRAAKSDMARSVRGDRVAGARRGVSHPLGRHARACPAHPPEWSTVPS
jgi:putative endonuclease